MAGAAIGSAPRGGGAPWNGAAFIAGTPPGIVTSNTAPARRMVFAIERVSRIVVRDTWSAADGTYRLDGLNPDLRFDVIGRDYTNTYEDVIVSRVPPTPYAMSSTGALAANDATNTLTGTISVAGGVPPLAVTVAAGAAPPGVTFSLAATTAGVAARNLSAAGAASNGVYAWTLRVTDADGRKLDIACAATFT
jgi:hypothetical protein